MSDRATPAPEKPSKEALHRFTSTTIRGQVFPTLREAIHHTATRSGKSMKELAADLDWSPTMLSLATSLGEENSRNYPADDAHLVKLMELTGDFSILKTLAHKMGFDLEPKKERLGELFGELIDESRRYQDKLQLVLDLYGDSRKGKR